MTSGMAPRRFSRLDVQLALAAAGLQEWQAFRVLEQLGVGDVDGYGATVARALGAVFDYNRPSFASPNTYGGMAWDQARTDIEGAVRGCTTLEAVWAALDVRAAHSATLHGFELNSYQHAVYLCIALIQQEYGPRPAPPAPPPPPAQQQASLFADGELLRMLAPNLNQAGPREILEHDFPRFANLCLQHFVRTWAMLPASGKTEAAHWVGAWLRSLGMPFAADEIETMPF